MTGPQRRASARASAWNCSGVPASGSMPKARMRSTTSGAANAGRIHFRPGWDKASRSKDALISARRDAEVNSRAAVPLGVPLARQERKILLHGLAKAYAGVDHDTSFFDPQRNHGARCKLQKR